MNVLVTGGGRGLGKLIAERLFEQGHAIIILDRESFGSLDVSYSKKIKKYFEIDLSDVLKVNLVVDEILNAYSTIHVIINNAAIRDFKEFDSFSNDEISRIITANYAIPLTLVKRFLPVMAKQKFGRIITISSISGLQGYALGTLYCSTKSALITFTEALALELSHASKNITANVLLPDSFQTREGVRLKAYDYITNQVISLIDEFINGSANGKALVVATPIKKLTESLKAHFHIQKLFA